MTFRMWDKLYTHYKNDFDMELMMKHTGTTYKKLRAKARKRNEWF